MIGNGFCNYEEFDSTDNRGIYNWAEQTVSVMPQRLNCSFGAQDLTIGGMVERTCESNLMWANYDGKQCATLDTARLRIITSVSKGLLVAM